MVALAAGNTANADPLLRSPLEYVSYRAAPYEWTITETAVHLGTDSIAAAMVHEAARTNGLTHQDGVAYGAGQTCGMRAYVISKLIAARLGWFMRIVK